MNYESYRNLRLLDKPAIQVYDEMKEQEARQDKMDIPTHIVDCVCGLAVFSIAESVIRRVFIFEDAKIWITSPSGKTTVALPLPIALRVIRKREWNFAEVEPINPPRVISRREGLRILLFGDKEEAKCKTQYGS